MSIQSLEKIKRDINENFKQGTEDNYIHYFVTKCAGSKAYEDTKFFKNLKKVEIEANQRIPLDSKRVNKWTPPHVAAIVNNIEAMKFFVRNGVSVDEKDAFNRTPYDYCQMFSHKELMQIVEEGRSQKVVKNPTGKAMRELLEKWGVKLPKGPYQYQANTHDFGIEIKKLLFSKPTDADSKNRTQFEFNFLNQNMEEITQSLGFKLEYTNTELCPRDHFILTSEGFKLPSFSEKINEIIEKLASFKLINETATDHPFLVGGSVGGAAYGAEFAHQEYDLRFPQDEDSKKLPFYFEGGNHYIFSSGKEKKLLIGKDLLYSELIEMFAFSEKYKLLFETDRFIKSINNKANQLTNNEIKDALKEMYELGLLEPSQNFPKGVLTRSEIDLVTNAKKEAGSYRKIALDHEYLKPPNLNQNCIKTNKLEAAKFCFLKELIKANMAQQFGLKGENVHFISQLIYHLDCFIHAGPKGTLFVQDFAMTKDFLQKIRNNAEALGLTEKDLDQLEKYEFIANKLAKELGPLQKKFNEELKQAGFILIPAPGIFYDDNPDLKNINFLNAVSGWSPKANHYYWIASGITAGDRLGQALMEGFKEFLQSYQPNLEVYFIGHDPQNPTDFSEAMQLLNKPGTEAGVHCLSLELGTQSHVG